MQNIKYFKWGNVKIRYYIDANRYRMSWQDIANALEFYANTDNWLYIQDVLNNIEEVNETFDLRFARPFIFWLHTEIIPFINKEEARLNKLDSAKNAHTESLEAEKEEQKLADKKIREYFIECEKPLPQVQQSEIVKNDIQIFSFEMENVRVIIKDNEPLFCLADICKVLEILNPTDTKNIILREFELPRLNLATFDTGYGIKEFSMITEQQLYFIMNRSDKPKAKPFRKWVNCEVLPTIRKNGNEIVETNANVAQTDIQVFNFEMLNIRVLIENGEPLFLANDVASILGYEKKSKMYDRIDEEDKIAKSPVQCRSSKMEFPQNVTKVLFINESGLYTAILGSKKENAKRFKRWVTKEVLPTIRKTGSYAVQPQFKVPQTYAEALLEAGRLALENEKLQAQIESDKPKVEFANNVSQAENEVSIGEFAKILNIKNLGEKNLFKWLREKCYLRPNNMPYQKYIDRGYFRVVEKIRNDAEDRIHTYTQTLITGKGQVYLMEKVTNSFLSEEQR